MLRNAISRWKTYLLIISAILFLASIVSSSIRRYHQLHSPGHSDIVLCVEFSPDGQILASGGGTSGRNGTILLTDVQSGDILHRLNGHRQSVFKVTFSPNGDVLASVSWDKTIKIWNVRTGKLIRTFTGPHNFLSVAFLDDNKSLMSCTSERTIETWDVNTGVLKRRIKDQHLPFIGKQLITFSPDKRYFASGYETPVIGVWDAYSGKPEWSIKVPTKKVTSLAFSPDGLELAIGSNQVVKLRRSRRGRAVQGILIPNSRVESIAFSPVSRIIANSEGNNVVLRDPKTTALIKLMKAHTGTVRAIAYSSDGMLLASASEDHTVYIWNAGTGTVRMILGNKVTPNKS